MLGFFKLQIDPEGIGQTFGVCQQPRREVVGLVIPEARWQNAFERPKLFDRHIASRWRSRALVRRATAWKAAECARRESNSRPSA